MKKLRYASCCDGIGAVHVAWHRLGWECAWTSEIEKFPIAVVEHHWALPNLGDMTKITEEQLEQHGPIDFLVGGTPCQSFSVAGLRGGLADARGNLALRFLQIAGVLRPGVIVWENVPGVHSSISGQPKSSPPDRVGIPGERWVEDCEYEETSDFACILSALSELGYGWAYRILDARYFGVAQRRRRVFVVGCLGNWRRAAAILFERDCLQGDTSPRRKTQPDVTGTIDGSTDRRRGAGISPSMLTATLQATYADKYGQDNQHVDAGCPNFVVEPQAFVGNNPDPTLAVRRLTPRECERLQGFPDDYTAIQFRGKPAADGPRYKALGNSMAVPCMEWIGRRIVLATT